ncbi:HlyD family type I secretion periplasmic adaptor subunit [Salipiger sp. IMCC34102]|uniref:HlyD family type I secretion periplasmic adaptor subunit n=1 Tax=Salipiger sp. IMCC34102 TaxID=2510647 RepID=UPI00101B8D77|nr:HlyD family type I secretion periplasmic adaptor subunit [Salipiger sp. IMCC34102]RYH02522.1 HlyD family type I secretion periplasmic adaptor subunit [Salipiger sp. IMCC34102]
MSDITATPGAEWYAEVPRSIKKHVIFGILLMTFTFGGFGVWAFRAPLAAAVIAQGSFVATGQNKIIQHLEGGIIEQINVREGDKVTQGEAMILLDPTVAKANERELNLRQVRLEATEARLKAQNEHLSDLVFPEHLATLRDDPEVAAILDGQRLAFQVAETTLQTDIALLERNLDALAVRVAGYEIQLASHEGQQALLQEDLEVKTQLLERGLIRRFEVNAAERLVLEAEGQISRLRAEIEESAQVRQKYEQQIEQANDRYAENALDSLQPIQAELDSVKEQSRTAADIRERSTITAPVSGTIVRLYYHTPGGVIESGRPILEVLPDDEPLIIEVQVPRVDIDSVRRGQTAKVRLTALNQRTTPILDGEVFYVSADSVTDSSAGISTEVYVARISIAPEEILRVPEFTPTPGMPAEIMIQTAERTFAQYLARPIVDSMSRAFREQ